MGKVVTTRTKARSKRQARLRTIKIRNTRFANDPVYFGGVKTS